MGLLFDYPKGLVVQAADYQEVVDILTKEGYSCYDTILNVQSLTRNGDDAIILYKENGRLISWNHPDFKHEADVDFVSRKCKFKEIYNSL